MFSHIVGILEGKKTKKEILAALKSNGLQWEDVSKEYGYMNIRVHAFGGYVRVYKPNGRGQDTKIQVWKPVSMKYSGVPVFEPSGRKSF